MVNRRTGLVEAGNGTLQAALSLGWTHVAALYVDDDPTAAAGFSIADNRLPESFAAATGVVLIAISLAWHSQWFASTLLLESRHEDNPLLWDRRRRDWTDVGRVYIAILDALRRHFGCFPAGTTELPGGSRTHGKIRAFARCTSHLGS